MQLKRAIKLLAFPFLADPPIPSDQKYKGIIEFPGFHTTPSFEIAAMYSIGRIHQNFTMEEGGVNYVTDYPVVVSLDMSGYEKHTDYDAEKIVKDTFEQHLKEVLEDLPEDATDEDIEAKIRDTVEFGDWGGSEYSSTPLDFLSENTFMHFSNPLACLADHPDAASIVREFERSGQIPADILMEATEQFRYVDDIDEQRITAVYYVTPVADEMSDYMDEDYDEAAFAARWPGFEKVGPDEAYGGQFSPSYAKVYGDTKSEDEYHGTTYARLLQAAPFLADVLPLPPSPPYEESTE